MKYCVIIEETRRIAFWFETENDSEAEKKAINIASNITDDELASGDIDQDYALFNEENGKTLIDWNEKEMN